jgi:hypothetical protein
MRPHVPVKMYINELLVKAYFKVKKLLQVLCIGSAPGVFALENKQSKTVDTESKTRANTLPCHQIETTSISSRVTKKVS